jgi:hypothetical protein
LAVGERVGGRFGSGAVFVALAGVTDPGLVVGGIGRAVGADLAGTGAPLRALAEQLGERRRFADLGKRHLASADRRHLVSVAGVGGRRGLCREL